MFYSCYCWSLKASFWFLAIRSKGSGTQPYRVPGRNAVQDPWPPERPSFGWQQDQEAGPGGLYWSITAPSLVSNQMIHDGSSFYEHSTSQLHVHDECYLVRVMENWHALCVFSFGFIFWSLLKYRQYWSKWDCYRIVVLAQKTESFLYISDINWWTRLQVPKKHFQLLFLYGFTIDPRLNDPSLSLRVISVSVNASIENVKSN